MISLFRLPRFLNISRAITATPARLCTCRGHVLMGLLCGPCFIGCWRVSWMVTVVMILSTLSCLTVEHLTALTAFQARLILPCPNCSGSLLMISPQSPLLLCMKNSPPAESTPANSACSSTKSRKTPTPQTHPVNSLLYWSSSSQSPQLNPPTRHSCFSINLIAPVSSFYISNSTPTDCKTVEMEVSTTPACFECTQGITAGLW